MNLLMLLSAAMASTRTTDAVVDGATTGYELGYVVAIGDVTSGGGPTTDGNADLVMRLEGYDDGASLDVGAVLVIPGPAHGFHNPSVASDPDSGATLFVGEHAAEAVGDSFAVDGDFNADGYLDLAIGASSYAVGPDLMGSVYIYFGPIPTGVILLSTSTADAVIRGTTDTVDVGQTLASAELDGAPGDELLVGGGYYFGSAGSVFIFAGTSLSGTIDATTADGILTSTSTGTFAHSLDRLETNAFIVSDPFCDEGYTNAGCAYVVDNSAGIPSGDISLAVAYTLSGNAANAYFGVSVAGLDFFQDVVGDVAVADPDGHIYIFDAPSVDTTSGSADIDIINSYDPSDWYTVLANGGPVDRGDSDDLLIGSQTANLDGGGAEGGAFVVYGDLGPDEYDLATELCPYADLAECVGGAATDDDYGVSVAGGDVNGDGRSDVLVGANGVDCGGPECGWATLYDGPFSRMEGVYDLLDGDALLVGDDYGDWAGYSVTGVGDVNCDGVEDLAVGAVNADETATTTGAVYVVFGPTPDSTPLEWLGAVIDLGGADFIFYDDAAGDAAGNTVGKGGDLDGDGCDELLVSSAGNDAGFSNAGMVYLFYGSETLSGVHGPSSANARFRGQAADDTMGTSVWTAGDFDGDSYDDLLLGAPNNDSSGANAGVVAVYYGRSTRYSGLYTTGSAPCRFLGEDLGDRAGWKVRGGMDFNGDGNDDVAIGAPGNEDNGVDAGAVYVVLGTGARITGNHNLSTADIEIDGASGSQLGHALAALTDIDGDLKDDLLAGAPYFNSGDGRAYWLPGRNGGWPFVYLAPAGGTSFCPPYAAPDDLLGFSTAGPGVDGDEADDLLIGSPGFDAYANNAGVAYLFYADTVAPWKADGLCHSAFDADVILLGDAPEDYAGWHVGDAGDLNLDGEDDLVVGAWGDDASATNAGVAYTWLSSH